MTNTNPSINYFEQVSGQWDKLRTGYFRENVRDAAIAKAYLHPKMTAELRMALRDWDFK